MTSICNCETCREIKLQIEKRKHHELCPYCNEIHDRRIGCVARYCTREKVFPNKIAKEFGYYYIVGDTISHSSAPGLFIIEKIRQNSVMGRNTDDGKLIELSDEGIGRRYHPKFKERKL